MTMMDERTGFARAGLAAMPALEDAPELYRPAPLPDDPLARQDERRDEDFALRAAAQATVLTRALSGAPPEGDPDGFTARLLARFDEESAALLENAPGPRAEDAAHAAIGRARGRLMDWALPQEAAAQTVARRQNLINGLAQFRAAAEQSPDDVDALHTEGAVAIAGATNWLGVDEAKSLTVQWTEELYKTAVRALLRDQPTQAAQQLEEGRYNAVLRPEIRRYLLVQARHWNKSASLDRAIEAQEVAKEAVRERAAQRQKFLADFVSRIDSGQAHRTELDEAIVAGIIPIADANRLALQLESRQATVQKQKSQIAEVTAFFDKKSDKRPDEEALATHYEQVMRPALADKSPWEQGLALGHYAEALGNLPRNVEDELRHRLHHADAQQRVHVSETITALWEAFGPYFMPDRDMQFAKEVNTLTKQGYTPAKAVKLAERITRPDPKA